MSATTLIIDHTGLYTNLTSNRQTEGLKRFDELRKGSQSTWYLGAIDTPDTPEHPQISARLSNGSSPNELVFQSRSSPYSASQLNASFLVESLPRLLAQLKPAVIEVFSVSKIGVEILRVARNHSPKATLKMHLHDGELLCPLNGVFINSDGVQCQSPSPRSCSNCTKVLSASDVFYRSKFTQEHLSLVDEIVAHPGAHLNRLKPWLDNEYKGLVVNQNRSAQPNNRAEKSQSKGLAFFASADDLDALQLLKRAMKLVFAQTSSLPLSIDFFPTDRHFNWSSALLAELEQAGIQVQSKWTPHYFERYMESYGWVILPSSPSAQAVRFVEMASKSGLGIIADDSYAGGDLKYAPHSAVSLAKAISTLGDS